MPRPGPRPYECIKRAWHSDRHQPIRGSIIQQIFRVVYERHGVKTKKNREWQEKLPVVVLKAEEIMYSKANSEGEYMDLDTLWDRVNDAIDTIIRRDDSAETAELLPPCVEAALNLGCVPVRASRSQRLSNPRSYLSPRTQEPGFVSPKILGNSANERNASLTHVNSPTQSTSKSTTNANSVHLASEFKRGFLPTMINNPPSSCENVPSATNRTTPTDSKMSLNVGSVFPLYHGTDFQPEVRQLRLQELQRSHTIILGRPVFPPVIEPAEVGNLPSLFSCSKDKTGTQRTSQQDLRDKICEEPDVECDLSLRLGLSLDSGLYAASGSSYGTQRADPRNSQEGTEFRFTSLQKHHEFSFFPVPSTNDPFGQQTSRWKPEGEGQYPEPLVRKRKVANTDNGQLFWPEGQTSNHFAGQMKRPGL